MNVTMSLESDRDSELTMYYLAELCIVPETECVCYHIDLWQGHLLHLFVWVLASTVRQDPQVQGADLEPECLQHMSTLCALYVRKVNNSPSMSSPPRI